jgi:hypothetical protein
VLFRRLATLELDAPTIADVDELRWRGPTPDLAAVARRLDAGDLEPRALALAGQRT